MRKKALIACALLGAITGTAFSWDKTVSRNAQSRFGDRERGIEVKEKYNYDPSSTYNGTIDNYGNVRTRNSQGDKLRGNIDDNGFGRLQDSSGNLYRVRPR